MPMKYDKLFALMKEKKLTTYRIRREKIISERTLQHMRDSKSIETESLCRLCKILDCQPGDIMEYVPEDDQQQLSTFPQKGGLGFTPD